MAGFGYDDLFPDLRGGEPDDQRDDEGHTLSACEVVRVSEKALLVRMKPEEDAFGNTDSKEEWIPKSQIHGESDIRPDSRPGTKGDLVITAWLAEKRGQK